MPQSIAQREIIAQRYNALRLISQIKLKFSVIQPGSHPVLELKLAQKCLKHIQKIGTGTNMVVALADIFLTKIDSTIPSQSKKIYKLLFVSVS